MRVDDPTVLPLSNTATADPNDTVVGVDFSGASGTVASQLNAALNASNLYFSGTSPNLRVLYNAGFSTVDAASVTTTVTSLTGGRSVVALFTDNGTAYSGGFSPARQQNTGPAPRPTA